MVLPTNYYLLSTLLLAFPLGIALSKITNDEKEIYSKPPYFPQLLWILAILSAIFITTKMQLGLTLVFIFLTTLTWHKTK
jgi:hypothetical protein